MGSNVGLYRVLLCRRCAPHGMYKSPNFGICCFCKCRMGFRIDNDAVMGAQRANLNRFL
jgi:hypothetical protein